PTACAGSPDELCNIPDASMATWPVGLLTMSKILPASAGIVRCTSKRSFIPTSSQGNGTAAPGRLAAIVVGKGRPQGKGGQQPTNRQHGQPRSHLVRSGRLLRVGSDRGDAAHGEAPHLPRRTG